MNEYNVAVSTRKIINAVAQLTHMLQQLYNVTIFIAKFFSCWSLLVHISLEEFFNFLIFKFFDFEPAQLMNFGINIAFHSSYNLCLSVS